MTTAGATLTLFLILSLTLVHAREYRSIDGTGNNLVDPLLGAAGTIYRRYNAPAYVDGIAEPPRNSGPSMNPRYISQQLGTTLPRGGDRPVTDMVTFWGQFLDHDIAFTPGNYSEPPLVWDVTCDEVWDPECNGLNMTLTRSVHDGGAPRNQLNMITGWIDGSSVYGSNIDDATLLRRNDGSGKLITRTLSDGFEYLPFNADLGFGLNMENPVNADPSTIYACGDHRCNENPVLIALHTLFVREHNRRCDNLINTLDLTGLSTSEADEFIYQEARHLVASILQKITYTEYMPANFGYSQTYFPYDNQTDGSIDNAFAASAFRYGHSEVNEVIARLDENMEEAPEGHLLFRDAFFQPHLIEDHGIDSLLRGTTGYRPQTVDSHVVDDLRNHLFVDRSSGKKHGAHGHDLFAINTLRGRDHGLADYNSNREAYTLFVDELYVNITTNVAVQNAFYNIYGPEPGDPNGPRNMDPYVAGLAEDITNVAFSVGTYFRAIINLQFSALEIGDRFNYRHAGVLTDEERAEVDGYTLAKVVRDNTGIGGEIFDLMFREPSGEIDCAGVVGGLAEYDPCGVCNYPGTEAFGATCIDCSGQPRDPAFHFVVDDCGSCLPAGSPTFNNCFDCEGTKGGNKEWDQCGQCLPLFDIRFNAPCFDCNNIPNGTALLDNCGECLDPLSPGFNACGATSTQTVGAAAGGTLVVGLFAGAFIGRRRLGRGQRNKDAELAAYINAKRGSGQDKDLFNNDGPHHSITGQRILAGLAVGNERTPSLVPEPKKKKKGITIVEDDKGTDATDEERDAARMSMFTDATEMAAEATEAAAGDDIKYVSTQSTTSTGSRSSKGGKKKKIVRRVSKSGRGGKKK